MGAATARAATPAASRPPDELDALRLWLRLFTATTMVERVVDSALKREFASSLPRFDLLAQLHRAPDGLRMGQLSERILTTNGNVTWLVAALEREGLVKRRTDTADRRATVVRLSSTGRRHFETMAARHAQLIAELFATLGPADRRALHGALDSLKHALSPTPETR